MIPTLNWSEPAPANEDIRYDHAIAQTPFGRIVIAWKSWKDYNNCDVMEAPGYPERDYSQHDRTLADCKRCCEQVYWTMLKEALFELGNPLTQQQPAADDQLYSTPDPKYGIRNNQLVVRATLKPIVNPIFIFRAEDRHLPAVLNFYLTLIQDTVHFVAVNRRDRELTDWQRMHPQLLKEPDTVLPE